MVVYQNTLFVQGSRYWVYTFPHCRHKVLTREQCVAKRQEKVRASTSWSCCGLWSRRERKASDAAKKYYNSSGPRPRPESSNVYSQAVQIVPAGDFNQYIRAQPQAPRRAEKPNCDPFWDPRDRVLPPLPLNITKRSGSSRPQARVVTPTPPPPPRVRIRTGAGRRSRVVLPDPAVVSPSSVTYDNEPLPDDDFLDMMHGFHR
ncbi:hypothetical protein B0T25DRAFT_512938 [Lasiosphaeria hispida]|uniref:Uncharacterized protein n=1 Tax=Lasiosphaeria hispida TaxID=260671 RepID=A0AAJ0HTU9_9PEZI|nr:hypothetical protein B0T25DRAFT_512938 [Lasiosphaeria hispida]